LQQKLSETLPPKLNEMIRKHDAYTTASFVESTKFLTIDLSLAAPMTITPTTIEAGIKGDVFDSRLDISEEIKAPNSIKMPAHNSSQPHHFQAFVNTYFLNNLFGRFTEM